MRHCIAGVGVPVIVEVKVAVPPTQLVKLAGLVTIGKVFTVIFALAGVVSPTGTLSTWVFTVAVPPVPFEVNVAVAIPDPWIVPCCALRLPKVVGPQLTGSPINLLRLATGIAVLAELERKLVVTVVVLPRPAGVLQIGLGEAVVFNCSHGSASNAPRPTTSPPAWLQGAVEARFTGFVLQPHQLFSAFTLPEDSTK